MNWNMMDNIYPQEMENDPIEYCPRCDIPMGEFGPRCGYCELDNFEYADSEVDPNFEIGGPSQLYDHPDRQNL